MPPSKKYRGRDEEKTLLGEGERREERKGEGRERERGTRQIRAQRESEREREGGRERVTESPGTKNSSKKISCTSSENRNASHNNFLLSGASDIFGSSKNETRNEPETRIEVKRILCRKLLRQKNETRENNLSYNELKFRSYVF